MVIELNQPVQNKEMKDCPIIKIIHICKDSKAWNNTICSNAHFPCDHNGCTISNA